MFVEKQRSWIGTILLGGIALPSIWMRTLTVTAISVLVTVVYLGVPAMHYSITSTPFVLIGLPLGIFLGFRNNTAYDRFWEGRKLWGSLVNTSRSLARQLMTLLEPQADEVAPPAQQRAVGPADELAEHEQRMVKMVIAFVHALRHQLRETDPFPTMRRLVSSDEVERLQGEPNVPNAIVHRLAEHMVVARRRRWIHPQHVPVIEQSLASLTDIQGACERVKSTPIPYSYTVLMHRLVAIYCGLLPFGLAETIGWATPVVVLFVSYALFGLDSIGEELEQPFGTQPNDLPLTAICRTIEANLLVRLGETPPPLFEPRDGIIP